MARFSIFPQPSTREGCSTPKAGGAGGLQVDSVAPRTRWPAAVFTVTWCLLYQDRSLRGEAVRVPVMNEGIALPLKRLGRSPMETSSAGTEERGLSKPFPSLWLFHSSPQTCAADIYGTSHSLPIFPQTHRPATPGFSATTHGVACRLSGSSIGIFPDFLFNQFYLQFYFVVNIL